MYTYIHTFVLACLHTYRCICIYVYICIYYVYIYTYIHIYTYMYTNTYIYIYVYKYMYTYIYVLLVHHAVSFLPQPPERGQGRSAAGCRRHHPVVRILYIHIHTYIIYTSIYAPISSVFIIYFSALRARARRCHSRRPTSSSPCPCTTHLYICLSMHIFSLFILVSLSFLSLKSAGKDVM